MRWRLTGVPRQSLSMSGPNFRRRPDGESRGNWPATWKRDVRVLVAMQARLREAIETLPLGRLDERGPGNAFTEAGTIRGIAAHDLYHAGQIQLLKRLQREEKVGHRPGVLRSAVTLLVSGRVGARDDGSRKPPCVPVFLA